MSRRPLPKINFQPWRQEIRAEKNRQFALFSIFALVASGALIFFAGTVIDARIAAQNTRNDYIIGQTRLLDKKLKEIKGLRAERDSMLERMQIIQSLQGDRPVSVIILDELVRVVPDGVFFETLSFKADKFQVSAIAEDNHNVSSLMRKIDGSKWFSSPNLNGISANRKFGELASDFDLSFSLLSQTTEDQEEKK